MPENIVDISETPNKELKGLIKYVIQQHTHDT